MDSDSDSLSSALTEPLPTAQSEADSNSDSSLSSIDDSVSPPARRSRAVTHSALQDNDSSDEVTTAPTLKRKRSSTLPLSPTPTPTPTPPPPPPLLLADLPPIPRSRTPSLPPLPTPPIPEPTPQLPPDLLEQIHTTQPSPPPVTLPAPAEPESQPEIPLEAEEPEIDLDAIPATIESEVVLPDEPVLEDAQPTEEQLELVEEEEEEEEEHDEQPSKTNNKKVVEKRKPTKRKKKRKGKGKSRAYDDGEHSLMDREDGDDLDGGGLDTPGGSDNDEEQSDVVFSRKRSEAMESLTRLEVEFAQVRDKLYIERMGDIERERIRVESGTHPELIHLTQLIEHRRRTKLDLARKTFEGLEVTYEREREADEHTVWNWWSDGRADLRTTMLDEANSKRRKLDREKRFIDRPQDDTLTSLLAPRVPPIVPLEYSRRLGFEGETLKEPEILWALQAEDLRTNAKVSALASEEAWSDMERMGLREAVRHQSVEPSHSAVASGSSEGRRTFFGATNGTTNRSKLALDAPHVARSASSAGPPSKSTTTITIPEKKNSLPTLPVPISSASTPLTLKLTTNASSESLAFPSSSTFPPPSRPSLHPASSSSSSTTTAASTTPKLYGNKPLLQHGLSRQPTMMYGGGGVGTGPYQNSVFTQFGGADSAAAGRESNWSKNFGVGSAASSVSYGSRPIPKAALSVPIPVAVPVTTTPARRASEVGGRNGILPQVDLDSQMVLDLLIDPALMALDPLPIVAAPYPVSNGIIKILPPSEPIVAAPLPIVVPPPPADAPLPDFLSLPTPSTSMLPPPFPIDTTAMLIDSPPSLPPATMALPIELDPILLDSIPLDPLIFAEPKINGVETFPKSVIATSLASTDPMGAAKSMGDVYTSLGAAAPPTPTPIQQFGFLPTKSPPLASSIITPPPIIAAQSARS